MLNPLSVFARSILAAGHDRAVTLWYAKAISTMSVLTPKPRPAAQR